MIKKIGLVDLMDIEWEANTISKYGSSYRDMREIFEPKIEDAFARTETAHSEDVQEYLVRIVIDNMTFVGKQKDMIEVLIRRKLSDLCYSRKESAILLESVGEKVLIYSSFFGKDFIRAGEDSFYKAKDVILSSEGPVERAELDNKMALNFERMIELLEAAELTTPAKNISQ